MIPKDILQLIFWELESGHDMLNFSELNRKSHQIFRQQIKIDNYGTTNDMRTYQGSKHGICRRLMSNGQCSYELNYYQGQFHGTNRGWYTKRHTNKERN